MNEVQGEEPYISDISCGGIESGHTWAEPKNDQSSALYLDANFEKAFKIDDISSVFHYELINDIGGLDSYVTGEGKDELRCGDLDEVLNEDKIADLLTVNLTNASEDYVLDVDFSKKVPEFDYQFCEELSFRKPRSEIHCPVTSSEVVGIPESSIPAAKCFNNQFIKTSCGGMQDTSEHKCRYETVVEDETALKCSLTCDLQNVHQTNQVKSLPEIGSSSDHNEGKTCLSRASDKASCTSACVQDEVFPASEGMETDDVPMGDLSTDSSSEVKSATGKQRSRRLCKPPQRYMEGSLWFKSRLHKARKCSGSPSKGKDLGVRSQRKHHKKAKASKAIENSLELDSDDEYDPLPSKIQTRKLKRSYGKKSNNIWTLDEVVSLVDGLAQFGLGQWTAVKRTFFLVFSPYSY